MANKAVSDEQIIAALMTHGTLKEAAAAVNISERTLYDRMNAGEFKTLHKAAKADLLRAAVMDISNNLQDAIKTIVEIMNSKDNNPAIRLQAAQTILNSAGKFMQRLQEDETSIIKQVESNKFSIW